MPTVIINWSAVLVAALANVVIGTLWYSKLLFGKPWQKAVKLSDKQMRQGAMPAMVGAALLALLTSFILAHFISYAQATTALDGAITGFWVWLGFVLTIQLTGALFIRRGYTVTWITLGNLLITFLVMGAILGGWS